MSNDSLHIPTPPVLLNEFSQHIDKEIILKEDFSQELIKKLNSKEIEIILPEEVTVKDKKNK